MPARKAYYLGLESYELLCTVVGNLSFCEYMNPDTGDHKLTNGDRVMIGVKKVEHPPYGAILILMGSFTPGEMKEIATLGKYDFEPLSEEVARTATGIAAEMLKQKSGVEEHHLLSREDAGQEDQTGAGVHPAKQPSAEPESTVSPESLLMDMTSTLKFRRTNAAVALGNLKNSSREMITALMIAKETDEEEDVQAAAATALSAPVHREFISTHPDMLPMIEHKIYLLKHGQQKPNKQSYTLEAITDTLKEFYNNLPEMVQMILSLLMLPFAIALIALPVLLFFEGVGYLWMLFLEYPLAVGVGLVVAIGMIALGIRWWARKSDGFE